MDSRVVLITGASSGIGKATALLFAEKGYRVAVHGFPSQDEVDKVVADCDDRSPNNSKAFGMVEDFADPKNAAIVVEKTVAHFGGLDVSVNNAGQFLRPERGDDSDYLYEFYRKIQALNIDSVVRVTYAAIKHLKQSDKDPNIVFLSSALSKKPEAASAPYCISKAAVSMFAQCLALQLAPKIRSNYVTPGPIFTPLLNNIGMYSEAGREIVGNTTPLKRVGEPHEVAYAIEYLASDKASFMTGTDIAIDGGYIYCGVNFSELL